MNQLTNAQTTDGVITSFSSDCIFLWTRTKTSMGAKLVAIVEQVRNRVDGMPSIDLARLNLKVGKALSRLAAVIADDPELVAIAEQAVREITSEGDD